MIMLLESDHGLLPGQNCKVGILNISQPAEVAKDAVGTV